MAKNTKTKKNNQDPFKRTLPLDVSKEENIAYMVKLFGFPYKKTDANVAEYVDGDLRYILMSYKGLPYGTTPRIILSWIITEAKLNRSHKISLGYNLRSFLKEIGVDTNGRNYKKTKEQLQALLDTGFEIIKEGEDVRHAAKFYLSEKDSLWWHQNEKQDALFNSEINLSPQFFEFCQKAFPISKGAMISLKDSPLALDLYFWLALRIFYLKRPVMIKWVNLKQQFGSNYKDNAAGRRKFKERFKEAFRKIKELYPDLNADVIDEGLSLRPSKTFIEKIK